MYNRRKIAVTIAFLVLITAFSLEITNQYGNYDSFNDVDDMLINFFASEKQTIVGMPIGILDYGEEGNVFDGLDYGFTQTEMNFLKGFVALFGFPYFYLYQYDILKTETSTSNESLSSLMSLNAFRYELITNGALNDDSIINLPGTHENLIKYLPSILPSINLKKMLIENYNQQDYIDIILKNQDTKQDAYNKLNTLSLIRPYLIYSILYDDVMMENIVSTYNVSDIDPGFSTLLEKFIQYNYQMGPVYDFQFSTNVKIDETECVELTNPNLEKEISWHNGENKIIKPICDKSYQISQTFDFIDEQRNYAVICDDTIIDSNQDYIFKFDADNVYVVGCKFSGETTPIKIAEDRKNIEIFGNGFQTTASDVIIINSPTFIVSGPSVKIIGNSFENVGDIESINLIPENGNLEGEKGFKGNVLIAKNTFKNTKVVLKGYDDVISIVSIIDNEFTKVGDLIETEVALWMKDISGGVVFGNTFDEIDNGIEVKSSENLMFVNNELERTNPDNSHGIRSVALTNSIISNNSFSNYDVSIRNYNGQANTFLENSFYGSGIYNIQVQNSQNSVIAGGNHLLSSVSNNIYIKDSTNTILYDNDLGIDNSVYIIESPNTQLYNVSYNLVEIAVASKAYFFYPIQINIKDNENNPVDNAQVIIKDDDTGEIVSQYLTGPAGWPINEDLYYYRFTKHPTGENYINNYKYEVYKGIDENGDPLLIDYGDINNWQDLPYDVDVTINDHCTTPPTTSTFQFKTYDPVTTTYVETLPETIIDPTTDYVNLYITEDTTFCPGTYDLYDNYNVVEDGIMGALIVAEDDVTITCDDTIFVGENNQGAGLYSDKNNLKVEGCTFKNYDVGMLIEGSTGNIITDNNFLENNKGLQLNQDNSKPVQAEITLNTFKDNKLRNLYLINPGNTNPSLIYQNNFHSVTVENNPNVYISGITNPADLFEEVRLFNCDEDGLNATTNICNGKGTGNYWSMYSGGYNDKFINYKLQYQLGVDDQGCPLALPNQCDGFYDNAYLIGLSDGTDNYIPDRYPYTSSVSKSDFVQTSASVEIVYENDLNLNAELTTTNEELDGVSYNWLVQEEGSIGYKPLAVVNYFFDALDEEEIINSISANALYDYSGNHNTAIAYGKPTIAKDCVGNCFEFDGIDDKVEIPGINLGIDGSFTIEFLIYPTTNDDYQIFDNKVLVGEPDEDYPKNHFLIGVDQSSNLIAKYEMDINGVSSNTAYIKQLTPNTWHHVAIIFDKENNKLTGIVDGVPTIIDFESSLSFDGLGDGPYVISGDNKFKGKLDEFKIYNNKIKNSQIIDNYPNYFNNKLIRAPVQNLLHRNVHDNCGNWQVQAYVTKEDLLLDLTTNLQDTFDKMPCGKTPCKTNIIDIFSWASDCEAPQICADNGFCEYKTCEGDDANVCDTENGEMCEFGKCVTCTDLSNLDETLTIDEDTLICGGEFNFPNWPEGKPLIEIKEDNVKLKCMDDTEIIGPFENYGSTHNQGILLRHLENIEISNCNISNFYSGILIDDVKNVHLNELEVTNNVLAFDLFNYSSLTINNNSVDNNIIGIYARVLQDSLDDALIKNTNFSNQLNVFLTPNSLSELEFENCYLNSSFFIEGSYGEDIPSDYGDLRLAGAIGSKIKFKDSYYDIEDVAYFNAGDSYGGQIEFNTELHNYWTLAVNVIDTADSSQSIPYIPIDIIEGGESVDLNEDGIKEDFIVTDEEGWARTYLLGNITDKNGLVEPSPVYHVEATNTHVVNAVAISDPFTMIAPKIIILDLEAGEEFKINTNTIDQVSQNSGAGAGKKGSDGCSPQFNDSCKKKYSTTPCVTQGDMNYSTRIYTCVSTNGCGTILFVEPCEGNAPSFSSSCNNQVRDLFEDDVDCGGPCPAICPATCEDGKKNQDESDIDCGGKCNGCLDNYACYDDTDCVSGYCSSGLCKQPTCYDNIKNQDEEQVDCGGNVCASCAVEQEASCYDGIRNQGEEQVDCGGPCEACQPILQEPKGFNYYWLLLLLIPMIGGLLGIGVFVYSKGHKTKKIPPMSMSMSTMRDRLIPPMTKGLAKEAEIKELPPIGPSKDRVLKKEIKELLEKGKPKHEIIERLKLKYPEERIKLVFEQSLHDVLPKKYEDQLKKYINHYYAKGLSKSALKGVLIEAGWSKKIVNKMIK